MPGGQYDSSKTRVAPVFDALAKRKDNWVPELLGLARRPNDSEPVDAGDLTYIAGHWGDRELALRPPVGLLSWLIRNPNALSQHDVDDPDRAALLRGNPSAVSRALDLLRSQAVDRAWYIFEGPTYPDAVIETPHALVVVEGKRTEAGPTTATTWMPGRHQIWRHIDAAWEGRGNRKVYGLFIVEGDGGTEEVPALWKQALDASLSTQTLNSSFPHRSQTEVMGIAACLVGVTTWQRVVARFGLPPEVLLPSVAKRI